MQAAKTEKVEKLTNSVHVSAQRNSGKWYSVGGNEIYFFISGEKNGKNI